MNSSDPVKPVGVNYDFSTARVSEKKTKAEGRLEIEIKDKQGMTHIVPFADVITSVGKEIQKAKNEAELGKAQKLINHFEELKTESAPLFKKSNAEFGFETRGYELADGWVGHLKFVFQNRAEELKENLDSFETREDYVFSLAFDFKECLDLESKIISLQVDIEHVESKHPVDKQALREAKTELREAKSELRIIKDSLRVTKATFKENAKDLKLGDWNKLIYDALDIGEFTGDEMLEVAERWGKK